MSVYSTIYKLFWTSLIALVIGVLPAYAQSSSAGGFMIIHSTIASIQAHAGDHFKSLAVNKHAIIYKMGLKRRIADLFKKSVNKNPRAKKIVRLLIVQAAKAIKRSRA